MNVLTQEQVRVLCRSVDFRPRAAGVASAIAMCESAAPGGADFDAVGDQDLANDTWGFSYGGFQIRSLRSQKGTGQHRDEDRLLDPEFNAASALTIKRQQGWTAWSVYTSGKYKAYLQDRFPPPPDTYIVVSGDTLSKVGEKVGVPWQDLARFNNIRSPYVLSIGQHLLLKEPHV